MQNPPSMHQIATPRPTSHWRKVSIDNGDMYVLFNTPIMIPMQRIVFGRTDSGDEAIAPSVEGETAGGRGDGRDGDVDDMTSGDGVDST